jgi:lysozyme
MENEDLIALCKRFEGCRLKPYLCPAGVATIGFGATAYPDGRKVALTDPPITLVYAEQILRHDAARFLSATAKLSPVLLLDPPKHAAIADFAFNLGVGRYRASTLRKRVDAEDWEGAAAELMKWTRGGGKVLPGLVKRRQAECLLLAK